MKLAATSNRLGRGKGRITLYGFAFGNRIQWSLAGSVTNPHAKHNTDFSCRAELVCSSAKEAEFRALENYIFWSKNFLMNWRRARYSNWRRARHSCMNVWLTALRRQQHVVQRM